MHGKADSAVVRKLAIAAALVVLLVLLYAAAAHWLAPRFIRDALAREANRLQLDMRLEKVRVNPFTLEVVLQAMELRPAGGPAQLPLLVQLPRCVVDVAWASLWERAWIVQRVSIEDGRIDVVDPAGRAGEPRLLQLRALALELGAFSTAQQRPVSVHLAASIEPGGTVSAAGGLSFDPPLAELKLEVENLPLAAAQPWLSKVAALKIASGTLSASGRLRLAQPGAQGAGTAFEGTAILAGLRLDESASPRQVLGWRRLETKAVKLRFAPFAASVGEATAREPRLRLVIGSDGRTNLSQLVRAGAGTGAAAPVQIARLSIDNGTLDFADRSLDTPFAAAIDQLSGVVSGIASAAGQPPARVALQGRVGQYGLVRIGGSIELDSPSSLTRVRAAFRNLELASFSPYAVKFAGYRVESGRLDADLSYRVREGRLVGENEVVIDRLKLGEKVPDAKGRNLPVELAVALLTDSQGRMNIAIPVSGNLNDPQFSFAGLFARAFASLVGKIASAPFRALGAVLSGGRGKTRGEVEFEPGAVALAPPQEENIARIAKALGKRPRLQLSVRAGYDPKSDPQAVQRRGLRRELAHRAGYPSPEGPAPAPLDLRDARIVHAAERLFIERGGNPLELPGLAGAPGGYGRAIFNRLLQLSEPDIETVRALGRARAEVVRAALVGRGVALARVKLEEPVVAKASARGIPTELVLGKAG